VLGGFPPPLDVIRSLVRALSALARYYFTRNETSLVAFAVGLAFDVPASGYTIIGAHTDSPCPK
jgi:aspartyl aminopeptidase